MMRLVAVVAIMCVSVCVARADHIGAYADPAGLSCSLTNLVPPPGTNSVYIVHTHIGGSTAAQFRIDDTTGMTPTTQTFPAGYLAIGTWNTDLSVAFGGCVVGQHLLLTLSFFYWGTPTSCATALLVAPAPTSPIPGAVVTVDCATPANLELATFGGLAIGPGAHLCELGPCGVDAVSTSSWGAIKAMYR